VNADDPLVVAAADAFPGRKVPFGTGGGLLVAAAGIADRGLEGIDFQLVVERREAPVRLAVSGRHNETNALAAAAAAHVLGVELEVGRAGAEAAGMAPDRIVVAQSHGDLAAELRAQCRPGDLVLLKGSRGAAMEEVLRRLETERRP